MKKIKVADIRLLNSCLENAGILHQMKPDWNTISIDCDRKDINKLFYKISDLKFKTASVQLVTDTKTSDKRIEIFNSEL